MDECTNMAAKRGRKPTSPSMRSKRFIQLLNALQQDWIENKSSSFIVQYQKDNNKGYSNNCILNLFSNNLHKCKSLDSVDLLTDYCDYASLTPDFVLGYQSSKVNVGVIQDFSNYIAQKRIECIFPLAIDSLTGNCLLLQAVTIDGCYTIKYLVVTLDYEYLYFYSLPKGELIDGFKGDLRMHEALQAALEIEMFTSIEKANKVFQYANAQSLGNIADANQQEDIEDIISPSEYQMYFDKNASSILAAQDERFDVKGDGAVEEGARERARLEKERARVALNDRANCDNLA